MTEIVVRSPAKLNLTFEITGLLPNGYHQVQTLMQAIDLEDELSFSFQPGKTNQVEIQKASQQASGDFPLDNSNLIAKAFELFTTRENANGKCGTLFVRVDKNVPIAAGLAGGSGNGAATLIALNQLFGQTLSFSELTELGAKLGADVPFCLSGGTQIGLERGDILTRVNSKTKLNFLVIKPRNLSIATSWVYQAFDEYVKAYDPYQFCHPNLEDASKYLEDGDLENAIGAFGNVFQPMIFSKHPQLADICQNAKDLGALACQLTGSGPSMFAVVSDCEMAHFLRRKLQDKYEQLDCLICQSINRGSQIQN